MADKHTIFVLNLEGKPLTPTTPARARKLLKAGVATKVWSKFNTFGIQLLTRTAEHMPLTTLGYDQGTKFEGYAVVCGEENNLAVKVDLPDKKPIVKKVKDRRMLRHTKRNRNCRRRQARFDNRQSRDNFIAPSQWVIVQSRMKILEELFRIYPISVVGLEDVRFNHAKNKWGSNFSTVEIGKNILKAFIWRHNIEIVEFQGFETQALREQYGYQKTSDKAVDKFEAHCTDALSLALKVGCDKPIAFGRFIVVDDTYRPTRRQLHDTQPAQGGVRAPYARGNVFTLRKGLKVGAKNGNIGQLCGETQNGYRYYDPDRKRQATTGLSWFSSQFMMKEDVPSAIASSR